MRNSVLKSNPFWSNNPPGPTTISEAQTTNYKVVVQNSNFISQRETPKFESESERKRAMTMGEDESSCSSNSGSAIDPPKLLKKRDAKLATGSCTSMPIDDPKIRAAVAAGASVMAVGLVVLKDLRSRKFIPREPRVNREFEREAYMNTVLYGGDDNCVNQIRMRPIAFFKLCKILAEHNLLQETIHLSIREQVLSFLHIVGHNMRFQVVGKMFYRSTETVHRYFRHVLGAVLKLHKHVVKQPDNETPLEVRNNSEFFPYFKDCVGAIDITHFRATVPTEIHGRFCGPKDGTTQNVLAAIMFDLKFTYVLAGWEGNADDSQVLNDALSRSRRLDIPEGKYYLGNAGYGVQKGILSPYCGVRCHLKEFSDHPPKNERELFNLRHSSLRTTIERCFGVLKKRFRVLDAESFWSFQIQVEVLLACSIIHNHILEVDPIDSIVDDVIRDSQYESCGVQQSESEIEEEDREWEIEEEDREWVTKRDEICRAMWEDWEFE